MKNTKTIYWVVTSLFSAFMIFTAIPDFLLLPDATTFMHQLGYPDYFTAFIGVAKTLGAIAILVPAFDKIKEWAYAGLLFDLIGAVYSLVAVNGFQAGIIFMLLPLALGILSYIFWQKRKAAN